MPELLKQSDQSRTNRIFFGWYVVAGAFASHFLSYGTLTVAFGIFFPFMSESLGWSRGLLASAAVVASASAALLGPLVGRAIDRYGPRRFVFGGGMVLAVGAAGLSLVQSPWHFFLIYGLVMAAGAVALGQISADATVSKWFVRRRGRAMAFATMGMSASGAVLPVPLAFLIASLDWRSTWVLLGIFIAVLAAAAAPLMRRRPEDYAMVPDGYVAPSDSPDGVEGSKEISFSAGEAMRTPAFWLLVASTNLATLAIFGANLHLFSYITDKNIPIGVAAGTVTYLYILQSVAKPIWGFVVERLHVRYCLALCYAGGALGIAVLVGTSSMMGLVAFATIYGMTRGAQSFISSMAWSNYFGREAQGAIRGTLLPFRFVSHATGPVFAGLMFDLRSDYTLAFAGFVVVFALGSLAAVMARPPQVAVAERPA